MLAFIITLEYNIFGEKLENLGRKIPSHTPKYNYRWNLDLTTTTFFTYMGEKITDVIVT